MAHNDGTIMMENAEIAFRNFAGREGQYNRAGDRNFCIMIDDDLASQLEKDGWNVKSLRVREPGDIPQRYLPVSIGYRTKDGNKSRTPPTMVMITSKGRTMLDEESIEVFDYVDIARVDLIIRPYAWNVSGNTGVKAYIKALYLIVEEDQLALRYGDLPEVDINGRQLAIGTGEEEIWDAEVVQEDTLAIEA